MRELPSVVRQFRDTVQPLHINPQNIQGNVLVIGHGPAIPERYFLSTRESFYLEVDPRIKALVCVEPELFCSPTTQIDNREVRYLNPFESIFSQDNIESSVLYYPWAIQFLWDTEHGGGGLLDAVDFFDAILFFRLPNLDDQLTHFFLDNIANNLKVGGALYASGSHSIEKIVETPRLKTQKKALLDNPDATGYPYSPQHVGIIQAKT